MAETASHSSEVPSDAFFAILHGVESHPNPDQIGLEESLPPCGERSGFHFAKTDNSGYGASVP